MKSTARQIFQSDMWGFIEVEEFVFGERSQLVVDPSEEKLKNEFKGVKRSYIPMHSIIRIDEVEKQGVVRSVVQLQAVKSVLYPFPLPILGLTAATTKNCLGGQRSNHCSPRCRVAFDSFTVVFRVEKVAQGMKAHPLSAALFFSCRSIDIDHFNIAKFHFS